MSMLFRISYPYVKRMIDLVLGILLLILMLPALVVCAIIIKIDSPGPVFFAQERTGKGGKRFKMFKFRTMVADAEELKGHYQHLNTQSYPDFKIEDDPRITKLGRILRQTSLDELPQIFNVIRGDMSLVGPRPTSFSSSTYDLWHTARLDTTPGITGLWQVNGRTDIDFDDRSRLDIAYIRNQSLWLDLTILLRTFTSVIRKEGR
ncbi:MAG: sugar transferase [Gammaproteobacteria bacterium]|nr:sugar transferase [Gammaproteobacteria bacterium]